MAESNKEVKVSKQELERAESMWGYFVDATKWSVIGIAVILVLMALTLI